MKIHRLEITGVGPFKDQQVIDFDPLTEAGLFLIDGPTGSGKTTIIDAIAYALFGDVSGGATSDAARMRSNLCGEDDPTGVTCEFSVEGRRHVISRVPKGVRDPKEPGKKAKSAPARQVLTELAPDGSEIKSLVRDDEIRQHIESLLRMNADQFRRLVVLPQGKFAELLVMRPKERLEALGSLLGEEYFARLQEEIRAEGERAVERQRAARDAVKEASDRLAGRLGSYLADGHEPDATSQAAFTDEQAQDAHRLAMLDALMASLAAQSEVAKGELQAAQAAAAAAVAKARAAEQLVEGLQRINQAQSDVADARARLDEVDAGIEDAHVAERLSHLTHLAGSLQQHAAWEADGSTRAALRQQKGDAEAACRAEIDALQQEQGRIPEQRAAVQAQRSQTEAEAAGLEAAKADERRLAGLLTTSRELTQLEPEQAKARAALDAAERDEAKAAQSVVAATDAWQRLVRTQLDQQAAHLATQLQAGEACPVCGSAEHPSPATPPDGVQALNDAEVEAADQAAGQARAAQQRARDQVIAARETSQSIDARINALKGALGTATASTIADDLKDAQARLQAAEAARELLASLDQELAALDQQVQSLTAQITSLTSKAAGLAGELKAEDEAEHHRQAQIRELIGEAPSATALLQSTQVRIAALKSLGDALASWSEAAAAVPPDQRRTPLEQARQLADDSQVAATAAEHARDEATEAALALDTAIEEAAPLAKAFRAAIEDRAKALEETKDAIFLADLATARSGANTRGLQLRSYALQRRFQTVLEQSSRHLDRMSAGRFSLELSEERAGAGHSGLGIAVFDAWSGTRQDPKSLSGGETFYAALSLALGLADVIRTESGGSALETLFVDEGFGSLDQDTLYLVLEQLDQLRAGGRAVGVVSHVTEMKEQIADRIEVRRQPDNTSRILVPGSQASR